MNPTSKQHRDDIRQILPSGPVRSKDLALGGNGQNDIAQHSSQRSKSPRNALPSGVIVARPNIAPQLFLGRI